MIEEQEAVYNEVVMEEASSSRIVLMMLDEVTGNTKPIPQQNLNGEMIGDIWTYADGKWVGLNEYESILVVDNGKLLDFQFQEDYFDESDFRSQLFDYVERMNIIGVSFSPDGKQLNYPSSSKQKIRSYNFSTGNFSDQEVPKVDPEYGTSVAMPIEAKDHFYFLYLLRGPAELYRLEKESNELKKAPFTFGGRGAFGLKHHPAKDQVIFIYDDITFAYHFESDKFQQFTLPHSSGTKGEELETEFNKIFYSYKEKEWRYAVYDNDQLTSKSIGLNDGDDSFTLGWTEVQSVIEKEKLKNQSPSEELTLMLKKLLQIPQPLSDPFKEEIGKAFVEFEQKYASRASEPEVQNALISSKIAQLDTALVTEEVVSNSKNMLIDWVKKGQLDFDMRLGARIIRDFATNQPPIHPARVEVLEELVLDHLEHNTMDSYQKLMSSGVNLLILAYTANEDYDQAINYSKRMTEIMEEYKMDVEQKPTYDQIKQQIAELETKR